MSTSATHSGTTPRVGRSGRGLGIAAAALAVVIAAGFVFAVNQGNEATVSGVEARLAEPAFQAESDRWTAMADSMLRSDPLTGSAELERLNEMAAAAAAAAATADSTVGSAELRRLNEMAASVTAPTGNLEQKMTHEFLEEQRSPSGPVSGNPLEGIAE